MQETRVRAQILVLNQYIQDLKNFLNKELLTSEDLIPVIDFTKGLDKIREVRDYIAAGNKLCTKCGYPLKMKNDPEDIEYYCPTCDEL